MGLFDEKIPRVKNLVTLSLYSTSLIRGFHCLYFTRPHVRFFSVIYGNLLRFPQ
jgi:hypothetical protein